MPNLVVVGAQWGDEGKGKVVDYLAGSADLVARYQGGPNAGHTVCFDGRELTFHQVPSGILCPRTHCVIGAGCVVDPYVLNHELAELRKNKISPGARLLLDARAHMIMPYHRQLDRLREEQTGAGSIGTTGQGIGPAYGDKFARTGIRAGDLRIRGGVPREAQAERRAANFMLMERYKAEPLSFKKMAAEYWGRPATAAKMVGDGSRVIEDALAARESACCSRARRGCTSTSTSAPIPT